jgi:hypothetical protein
MNLYGAPQPSTKEIEQQEFTNDMNKILSNPITKEFYKTINIMAKGRSHGPNGAIIEFYIFF